jgi:hypothetical protein
LVIIIIISASIQKNHRLGLDPDIAQMCQDKTRVTTLHPFKVKHDMPALCTDDAAAITEDTATHVL